jgi:hypothetical protein
LLAGITSKATKKKESVKRCINLKVPDFIKSNKNRTPTIGMEVEMYVTDKFGRPLNSREVMEEMLEVLPKKVTKDHYQYQIEIRTAPHNNPDDLIKDFMTTLKKCVTVFKRNNLYLLPYSWLGGGEMFNGVHFHVTYKEPANFYNMLMNSYPLLLLVAYNVRNSPASFYVPSKRTQSSQHMGLPNMTSEDDFNEDDDRFRDVAINKFKDNSRHRMKSVNTFEIRMFDTPNNLQDMKYLVRSMFEIYNKIPCNSLIVSEAGKRRFITAMDRTRFEIANLKRPHHHLFDDSCRNLTKELYGCLKVPFKESKYNKFVKKCDTNMCARTLFDVRKGYGLGTDFIKVDKAINGGAW